MLCTTLWYAMTTDIVCNASIFVCNDMRFICYGMLFYAIMCVAKDMLELTVYISYLLFS